MSPVKSSQIESVGHDPETSTLAIRFKSGGTYHYQNVSADQHNDLVSAESVGSHFHNGIKKNSKAHPYKKQS